MQSLLLKRAFLYVPQGVRGLPVSLVVPNLSDKVGRSANSPVACIYDELTAVSSILPYLSRSIALIASRVDNHRPLGNNVTGFKDGGPDRKVRWIDRSICLIASFMATRDFARHYIGEYDWHANV